MQEFCICRAPLKSIVMHSGRREWVHDQLLGELHVSQDEHSLILADPIPPGHNSLHRKTFLHQPKPAKGGEAWV